MVASASGSRRGGSYMWLVWLILYIPVFLGSWRMSAGTPVAALAIVQTLLVVISTTALVRSLGGASHPRGLFSLWGWVLATFIGLGHVWAIEVVVSRLTTPLVPRAWIITIVISSVQALLLPALSLGFSLRWMYSHRERAWDTIEYGAISAGIAATAAMWFFSPSWKVMLWMSPPVPVGAVDFLHGFVFISLVSIALLVLLGALLRVLIARTRRS
jgi:hypothetical protein